MNVSKIVEQYISTYFICNREQKTLILLYKPYNPYKPVPVGYALINAFYPASNELYYLEKAIIEALHEYNATAYKGNLKKLFLDTKNAIALKNALIAIPPYGTRTALAAIEIDRQDDMHDRCLNIDGFSALCSTCNRCVKACPTDAFDADSGFIAERCLRYAADHIGSTEVDLKLLEKSILGCDKCQEACPYNTGVESVDMPEPLLEILQIDRLMESATKGRKALFDLGEYIGQNYNRPQKILALTQIARSIEKD